MKTAADRGWRTRSVRGRSLAVIAMLVAVAVGWPAILAAPVQQRAPARDGARGGDADADADAGNDDADDDADGAMDDDEAMEDDDDEAVDDDDEAMDDDDEAMEDDDGDDDDAEAMEDDADLEIMPGGPGSLRFIPRGFVRRGWGWGGGPPAPAGVLEGPEDAAGPADPAGEMRTRLETLREVSARLRTELQAAEAEYAALVEPTLGADHWATLILDRVDALGEADAARAAQATAAHCMRSIAAAGAVRVEEGVARSVHGEALEALVATGEVRSTDGFWYHVGPTACDAVGAARLTALVVDPATLRGPGGGKFCGGFHPDLRLDYGVVEVLVCFGCRDIRYQTRSESVTFDLSPEALARFEAIGRTIFRHRAEPDAAE